MAKVVNFLKNTLDVFWSAVISDPIKSIGAFAATISAFAAIGALIIGWKNLKRGTTRVDVIVKRAQNGPLILQNPQKEFLLFEVYNQCTSPIVINEVGIKFCKQSFKKARFVNLVDLAYSCSRTSGGGGSAIGSLKCVDLPDTIPPISTGIFLLDYSGMKETANSYKKQRISPSDINFVGSERVIRTFQIFRSLELMEGQYLQITPYIMTGSGEPGKITRPVNGKVEKTSK